MKKLLRTLCAVSLACIFMLPSVNANAETAASKVPTYNVPQNDLRYYEVEHKGALGIPVTCTLKEAEVSDIRAYTVTPNFEQSVKDNIVTITISNANLIGDKSNCNDLLKTNKFIKNIKISSADNNSVKLTVEFSNEANVSISTVKRRYSYVNDAIQFRTYIDIVFEEKGASQSKVVVIDPGHGGGELGAADNFTYEKNLNLDISRRIVKGLKEDGYQVYITRNDDSYVGLLDRTDPANLLNADLFFCIHNNSVPLDMTMQATYIFRGTTVLYNSSAPKPGKDFAKLLLKEVSSEIQSNTAPLQDRPGLAVLSSAWCPAVLMETTVECDDSDAKMMMHRINRQKIADASVKAVDKYFSNK